MKNIENENLRLLAKSWNTLDISPIIPIICEDFIFESQWVLVPIVGKAHFLEYLNSKFNAIKNAQQKETISINAELGMIPKLDSRPCIILTQLVSDEKRQVTVLITLKTHLIAKMQICSIPNPTDAITTGEFPN